jgi:hypothetical protein
MRLVFIFGVIVMMLVMSSCSTNQNDPIDPGDSGSDPISITTNASDVIYISLAQKQAVDVVKPMLENSWDISIDNVSNISVNGGSTAPGKVFVHKVETDNYSQISKAPDGMYMTDTEKSGKIIGENWYFYDVNTHSVSPLDHVYIIKTVDGEYYKMRITDATALSRFEIELKILIDKIAAPSAPEFQDPSGRVRTAVFTLSGSEISYFQLKSGEEVEVSNPANSTEWDINSEFVTLAMNGGTSGSGQAGAIVYESTPMDSIKTAPSDGYVTDDTTNSKMAIGDAWYNYDFMTHQLSAHPYGWVVKTAQGKYAKLEFVETDFEGQSGGVAIIRFMYLESGNQF